MDDDKIWQIRAIIYQHVAETTRPPSVDEAASRFGLTHEEAAAAYEELHQRHALYLKPGTHDILMANPFSGVETLFRVRADGKTYFANCAWDALGIPAALHTAAEIEAACRDLATTGRYLCRRKHPGQLGSVISHDHPLSRGRAGSWGKSGV